MHKFSIKPLDDEQLEVLGNTFAGCNIKLNGVVDRGFSFKNFRISGTVEFEKRRLQVYSGVINATFNDMSHRVVPFRCSLEVVADIVDKLRK